MSKLEDFIKRVNPFAREFQMLHEVEERVITEQGFQTADIA